MATRARKTAKPTKIVREYDFLECRTFGHKWDRLEHTSTSSVFGAYTFEFECSTCTMRRRYHLDVSGDVMNRNYVQPEGYRAPGVERRAFRAEFIRRFKGSKK